MRSLMSGKIAKEISKDWAVQLEMKKRLECETKEEELYWTKLNEMDMMEKVNFCKLSSRLFVSLLQN